MERLAPDVVLAGKLRLLRPLGHGGMGVVWAARHLSLHTDVAVKLIRPERAAESPALLARFEREAMATARIAHPHVVKIMDYGAASGVPYIVMELLRGFTLADLLERGGRLSFATARSLVAQIGAALESAHEQGVVHRDIKPHNIFITEGSRGYPLFVKVLDFGVAKMADGDGAPPLSTTLTETGVVIGSAPYMSPEQLEGRRDVDRRADLWALAVIVYEALTGERPFQGTSFVSVGAAVLKGRYRPVTELRPNLPPAVDDWFAKALSLDPDGRFPSAREMVAAFNGLAIPPGEQDEPSNVAVRAEGETAQAGTGPEAYASTVTAEVAAGNVDRDDTGAGAPPPEKTAEHPTEGHAPPANKADEDGTAAHAPPANKSDEDGAAAHAPPANKADEDGAAAHAPPANKSDEDGAAAHAPGRKERSPRRRRALFGLAALAAAIAAGAGLWRATRATPLTSCPAGMKLIEGGTFPMGSPAEGETPTDETPVQEVTIASFCLDATEVTVSAYSKCDTCGPPAMTVEVEGLTPNNRDFWSKFCNGPGAGSHPRNCVNWESARAYCAFAGKRLPTEAEWEVAARGKEARLYPWGARPPPDGRHLNACGAECSRMLTERREKPWPGMHDEDDLAPATAPVGSYPEGASAAGILDLAGNVWEWTASYYCRYGEESCEDTRRVLRGGGWDTVDSQFVRATKRLPSPAAARGWSIGFRCAFRP